MKLSELPDDFTPEQFMQLDADALNQLPYTIYKLTVALKIVIVIHRSEIMVFSHFIFFTGTVNTFLKTLLIIGGI
jgi:hypothetical protein